MEEQIEWKNNFTEEELIPMMKAIIKEVYGEEGNVRLMSPIHFSIMTFDERENRIYKFGDEYHIHHWQLKKLTKEDLRKFLLKNLALVEEFQTDKVYTFIIYSEEIEEDIIYKTEQCCFKPYVFSLKQLDADKILIDLKIKIENNEEMTTEDNVNLSFLPYYKSKRKPEEILHEVCSLTKQIKNIEQEDLESIRLAHLLCIDKFVTDDKKENYLKEMGLDSDSLDLLMDKKDEYKKYFILD